MWANWSEPFRTQGPLCCTAARHFSRLRWQFPGSHWELHGHIPCFLWNDIVKAGYQKGAPKADWTHKVNMMHILVCDFSRQSEHWIPWGQKQQIIQLLSCGSRILFACDIDIQLTMVMWPCLAKCLGRSPIDNLQVASLNAFRKATPNQKTKTKIWQMLLIWCSLQTAGRAGVVVRHAFHSLLHLP